MKEMFKKYPKSLARRASQVKALFTDVDGVWTNGSIIYDETGKETKIFNVKDGQIISHLRKAGILTGVISGRESAAVSKRATELRLDFCHQGIVDKADTFAKLLAVHKLKKKEVVYIGDDINDLAVLRQCGISVCPADAPVYIKKEVDFVTESKGGEGVVREVADLILAAQGRIQEILKG